MDTTVPDSKQNVNRCVNCGLSHHMNKAFSVSFLPSKCQEILAHWIGVEVPPDVKLCYECNNIINQYSESTDMPERVLGHKLVCIGCGQSIYRDKRKPTNIEKYLHHVSVFWPWHKLYVNKVCCYKCYSRLIRSMNKTDAKADEKKKSEHALSENEAETDKYKIFVEKKKLPSLSTDNQIMLIDGVRAGSTSSRCSYSQNCQNKDRRRIEKGVRTLLATNYNIYLPDHNRACIQHQTFEGYEKQIESSKYFSNFQVSQFELFLNELKTGVNVIDFENVTSMSDHVCRYWTGLSSIKFVQMFEDLNQPKLMKTALATYLIMKSKGDGLQKLAKLFNIPSLLLSKQVKTVEKHYAECGSNMRK